VKIKAENPAKECVNDLWHTFWGQQLLHPVECPLWGERVYNFVLLTSGHQSYRRPAGGA